MESEAYIKFENIITFSHLQVMLERKLGGMKCLSLGSIDIGSFSQDRNTKSLTQRWFTKHKVNHSKEENSTKKKLLLDMLMLLLSGLL